MQDLSNIHENVIQLVNDTGKVSPILEISPDTGLFYRIRNAVNRGSDPGIPMYFDLRDSNDDPLPVGTSVRVEFESPGDEQRNIVSEVRDNIQPWLNLSIRDQQDEEYIDSVKVPLKGPALTVRDIDTMYVSIESSAAVDWDNSEFYLEGNAVTESPK